MAGYFSHSAHPGTLWFIRILTFPYLLYYNFIRASREEPGVAKKHNLHRRPPVSAADLKARIERAAREDRYQQALELAKNLYKSEPVPAHRELLQRMSLGRARQLRQQGAFRDACTILSNAVALDGNNPAWRHQLATEFAACGEPGRALALLEQDSDPSARGQILTLVADTALQKGPAGRSQLPAELHGQFDLILRAFAQSAAGEDAAARETLQGIGLQSPFLEWKLLIRGLLAYYQKDDERAIENWQRLNVERLPAKLAAPLRFRIDPAFRQAQAPETQTRLQKQGDLLQASPVVAPLRALQAALSRHGQLPQAFRLAEGLLPELRREAPQLVPRLAACFYWAIIHGGQPKDIDRYRRVFGTPPDDPHFARLEALALESIGQMQQAHECWKKFEQSVADNPAAWPGEIGRRARALVWWHMGNNAAAVPDEEKLAALPPFLRDHPDRPRPLKPTAEQCYRHSLELAPDQLETYEALFEYYHHRDKDEQAIQVAEQLLQRFPEHVPTLTALGGLYMEQQKYPQALNVYERALKVNPLDRKLREKLSTAHLFHARGFAEQGEFEQARAEYRAAQSYAAQGRDSSILCKWAACEFKAGDTARSEELLQQALEQRGSRLGIAFSMLIEAIRLKLPALKRRFNTEFNAALNEPPTAAAAVSLASTAASHHVAGVTYHGQKTHEKKVLAYLTRAQKVTFSEEQLENVCTSLLGLKALRLLRDYAHLGQRKFPKDPFFPYIEAESYISEGSDRCPMYQVSSLLDKARQLVEALPREHRHWELQEPIEHRLTLVSAFSPFGPMGGIFGSMLEQLLQGEFDEEDFEDDEDWE